MSKRENCDGNGKDQCTNCTQAQSDSNEPGRLCTYFRFSMAQEENGIEAETNDLKEQERRLERSGLMKCGQCPKPLNCNLMAPCRRCLLNGYDCEYPLPIREGQKDTRLFVVSFINFVSPERIVEGFTISTHMAALFRKWEGNTPWVVKSERIADALELLKLVEDHGSLMPNGGKAKETFSSLERTHTSEESKYSHYFDVS